MTAGGWLSLLAMLVVLGARGLDWLASRPAPRAPDPVDPLDDELRYEPGRPIVVSMTARQWHELVKDCWRDLEREREAKR